MPATIDTMASASAPRSPAAGFPGTGGGAGGCAAAILAATRMSISLPTLSRNDSMTADWYSGPISWCVAAAARISSGVSDGLFTRARYIALPASARMSGSTARRRGAAVLPGSVAQRFGPVRAVLAERADPEPAPVTFVEEHPECPERRPPRTGPRGNVRIVQQHGGPARQVAEQVLIHRPGGRSGRPLPSPARPQHGREYEPARGDQAGRAQHAIRRAEQPGIDASGRGDDLLGLGQVGVRRHRAAQRQIPVTPAVHADLVTRVGDVGRKPR